MSLCSDKGDPQMPATQADKIVLGKQDPDFYIKQILGTCCVSFCKWQNLPNHPPSLSLGKSRLLCY